VEAEIRRAMEIRIHLLNLQGKCGEVTLLFFAWRPDNIACFVPSALDEAFALVNCIRYGFFNPIRPPPSPVKLTPI
jgi:hypothetical protein